MAFIKHFITFAIVLSVVSPINAFDFIFGIPYAITIGVQRAWTYCPANSTNATAYEEVLDNASGYFESFPKNQSLCYNIRKNAGRCFRFIADYFMDCLPEQSKDLMPAVVKTLESLVDAFCTSSGEILLEVTNPCLDIFRYNETVKEECKPDSLLHKYEKFEKDLPFKSEACQAIREVGDCWQEYVNLNCESSKTKEFFSIFYNAASISCKD